MVKQIKFGREIFMFLNFYINFLYEYCITGILGTHCNEPTHQGGQDHPGGQHQGGQGGPGHQVVVHHG